MASATTAKQDMVTSKSDTGLKFVRNSRNTPSKWPVHGFRKSAIMLDDSDIPQKQLVPQCPSVTLILQADNSLSADPIACSHTAHLRFRDKRRTVNLLGGIEMHVPWLLLFHIICQPENHRIHQMRYDCLSKYNTQSLEAVYRICRLPVTPPIVILHANLSPWQPFPC